MVINMNKKLKHVCFFAIIFLIIDQAIKFYLSGKMVVNQTNILIQNFLNITYVHNTGAAFSLFSGFTWVLILIGVLALAGLIFYLAKTPHITDFEVFIYSLLLGGIAGNLLDRIIHGYVIDYISLNLFGYHFPIFNFADICIVGSMLLIFATAIKGDLWKD